MHNQFFQNTFPVKFFSIVSNKNAAADGTCCHTGRQSRKVKCLINSLQSMKEITSPLVPENSVVKFLWYCSPNSCHLLQPSFSRLPLRFSLPYLFLPSEKQ